MVAPFGNDVGCDSQQVRLRIANISQVTRAKQAQVRLLRQVFNVHARPYPPANELKQAAVPTLSPTEK
jgi:hypothetical protein